MNESQLLLAAENSSYGSIIVTGLFTVLSGVLTGILVAVLNGRHRQQERAAISEEREAEREAQQSMRRIEREEELSQRLREEGAQVLGAVMDTFFEVNHREIHEGPDRRGATDRLMAQWGRTRVALTRFGYLHPDLNVFQEVTRLAIAFQEVVDDLDNAAMYFGFQTDSGLTRARDLRKQALDKNSKALEKLEQLHKLLELPDSTPEEARV